MTHDYPPGMTPREHDQLADDYDNEARALRQIVARLETKANNHRGVAEDLRAMYADRR